jgi:hypothetical protein
MRNSIDDYRPPSDDALPLFAAARRSDPPTSVAAAQAMTAAAVAEHERAILEALRQGPAGKTEIGRRAGITDQQVIRRMHRLERMQIVEKTGRNVASAAGRAEAEYRVV